MPSLWLWPSALVAGLEIWPEAFSFIGYFYNIGDLGFLVALGTCNDPKPLCKDHHGFGVFLNFFWLWYFVKHFAELLV
jgi:hypothetical protein